MENESKNLINLFDEEDDEFNQFDPLSSMFQTSFVSLENNSSTCYSDELLNFDCNTLKKNQQNEKLSKPKRIAPPPPQHVNKPSNPILSLTPDVFNTKTYLSESESTQKSTEQFNNNPIKESTTSNSSHGYVSYLNDSNNQVVNNSFKKKSPSFTIKKDRATIKKQEKSSSFVSYVNNDQHLNQSKSINRYFTVLVFD